MNEEWRNELVTKGTAYDALANLDQYAELGECLEVIKGLPSAQPKRIKGRWERKESDLSWWYECSECGKSPLFDPYENEVLTRFCPWCGARMEEEEDAAD